MNDFQKMIICCIVPTLYYIIFRKIVKLDEDKYPDLIFISAVIAIFIQSIVVYTYL